MQRVLITGASSGMGAGLARAYAAPGAVVGLIARREQRLDEVARLVRSSGGRAIVLPADVTDAEAMRRALETFADAAGGIEICIANAGIAESRRDGRFDVEAASKIYATNVLGVVNTLFPCAKLMLGQGRGTLVAIASAAGHRTFRGSPVYSSSKAAVISLMEGLQLELAGSEVSATTICPGFVRTPMNDDYPGAMPFAMECDEACARVVRAIQQKKLCVTFPEPIALWAVARRAVPQWILMRRAEWSSRRVARNG